MMDKLNLISKYKSKAKDSFRTKFDLYLFEKHISNTQSLISQDDFMAFKITPEIIEIYTTVYWNHLNTNQSFNTITGMTEKGITTELTINELYQKMKEWRENNKTVILEFQSDYVTHFDLIFPFEEFKRLYDKPYCHYCNITEEQINELIQKRKIYNKTLRGFTLEIDRPEPNYEYTSKNAVLCCYWCNNAKTDEFLEDEFLPIGKEIEKIWKKRLNGH